MNFLPEISLNEKKRLPNSTEKLRQVIPVKSVKIANTPIGLWRQIFAILSIKIKLQRELIAIIYLLARWNSISKLLIGKGTHVLDISEIKETLVRGNVPSKKNKETNIRKNLMGISLMPFLSTIVYISWVELGVGIIQRCQDLHFSDLLSQGLKGNLSKVIYFGIKDNHCPSKG